MDYLIKPGQRSGKVQIPSSKSFAHRYLICAALSEENSILSCDGFSKDIMATVDCLRSLGVKAEIEESGQIIISPARINGKHSDENINGLTDNTEADEIHSLNCGESGSTLRFLLPIVSALGIKAEFNPAPGLYARPMEPLIDVLKLHGAGVSKTSGKIISEGRLTAGRYDIPGNISSQYISGLLFALPLLKGDSELHITGKTESSSYVRMTEDTLHESGIVFRRLADGYFIPGNQKYGLKGKIWVESDWSNAAFFLCMGALSDRGITLNGMKYDSSQGDKAILDILSGFGADVRLEGDDISIWKGKLRGQTVDASEIPDLIPVISALASCIEGKTEIINASRLRFKESDRLKSTASMLKALGAEAEELEDGLVIIGKGKLAGGTVDPVNDHRIAMAAAVASSSCINEVTVLDSECVEKSYPMFWKDLSGLEIS